MRTYHYLGVKVSSALRILANARARTRRERADAATFDSARYQGHKAHISAGPRLKVTWGGRKLRTIGMVEFLSVRPEIDRLTA